MQYTSKFSGEEIDSILDSVASKQDAIPDLETIRSNAKNASDTIARMVESGYLFAGIATIDTNPGTPDAKVFYIANGKGTYEKFGGLEVTEDEVVVLYWDTAWHKVATGIASQAKLSELEKTKVKEISSEVTEDSDSAIVITTDNDKPVTEMHAELIGSDEECQSWNSDDYDDKGHGEQYAKITPKGVFAKNFYKLDGSIIRGGGSYWIGKNVYFFGDSLSTAGKMNDMAALKSILQLNKLESRSIGGQRYGWNGGTNPSDVTASTNGGSICWVRPDGSFIARNDSFNKDTFDGTSYPSGVTQAMVDAGTAIPVRGSACSWLRITKMFPSSIKDNVDAVLLFYHNDSLPVDTPLSWVSGSNADTEWAADTNYYNGGDYNIDCLNGGIASAIMKLQIWMPNATIILCTPVNSFGEKGKLHYPEYTYRIGGVTLTKRIQADAVIEMGKKFAISVADVFGESGINTMNRTTYVPDNDTIHPNAIGNDRIAKAIAMKLLSVFPH